MAAPAVLDAGRELAAAVHVLGALWSRARGYVDDGGGVDWLGLELAAGVWPYREWLLVRAAHDLAEGRELAGLAGWRTLDTADLRRVLEAVCVLRPDVAPPGGWAR